MTAASRTLMVCVAALALGGCAQRPFVDSTLKELTANTVRICYNGRYTTPEEIVGMAREVCAEKRLEPKFVKHERYQCRLLVPNQVTYQCVKPAE
jgi:hypothetical protein